MGSPDFTVQAIERQVRALTTQDTSSLRAIRRNFSRRLRKSRGAYVIKVARRLLLKPGFEYRFLAYELIACHRQALGSLRAKELGQFGKGIDSWAAVDTFALYLSGPAWREKQVGTRLIERWAHSKDRWWRRAALVSTVALNSKARGGAGDTSRTLHICGMLIDDRDDMVVKAMSWALRALAARNRSAVRSFLSQNKHGLAARVLREVRNKLATGLKNPRRPLG